MFGKAINSSGEIQKQYMYELRKETGKNERRRQVRGMKGTGNRDKMNGEYGWAEGEKTAAATTRG